MPRGISAADEDTTPGVRIEVWTLHVQLQRNGSPDALAALVEEYSSYAHSIARRLARHLDSAEDVEQVAMEALVSSLRRFDVDRGLPFPAFARPTITGAIKRHYRDRGWAIRTPRSVHDIAGPLRDAEDRLSAEHGRHPTRAEVADEVGLTEDAVRRADQAIGARDTTSLDRVGPTGAPSPIETLGRTDPHLARVEARIDLRNALDHLGDRDASLLALYYGDELSQREIGARLGISQMQVSRRLSRCVGRLRARVVEPSR